ncbi:MAG: discoidin domain-containing protein, partial [Alistipes sp.]|nr:discoidin domain-containing protein [Alistipes sp.]
PGKGSIPYAGPVVISQNTILKAVAVLPNGIKSAIFTEDIGFNKATLRSFESFTEGDRSYNDLRVLTDGVKGKTVYGLGGWAGFRGNGMDIVIDLGEPTPISTVTAYTMSDFGSHILDATSMKVLTSTDNVNFREVASATFDPHEFDPLKLLFEHTLSFESSDTRYVRVVMDCDAQMPPERYDPGIVPFMFVSEIAVD